MLEGEGVAPTDSRATPGSVRFQYHGSLDGLRALAVLVIIAFHYNYSWASGGFLGVDLFFVLSGFLITTLLVLEWRRSDRIALGEFWGRRARRLLPALMLVLVLVAVITLRTIDPWNRAGVRDDGIASLFYVANWRFIAAKQGYFELFSAASPLRHMWSLAIEEQFYLVWPLVVYAALRVGRGSLRLLGAVCAIGIMASVVVMGVTYRAGSSLRAYYGTDARAHTILMGALLALVLVTWTPGAAARRRLRIAAVAGFAGMVYAWWFATGTNARYYRGGSIAYAAVACVVVAGALQPGRLRAALSVRPLTWIGRISYGLYLFHWPLVVWLVPTRLHGLHGLPLNVLRFTATFVAATASFYLVELPIRERRRPTLPWSRVRPDDLDTRRVRRRNVTAWLALPAVGLTLVIVLSSTTGATPAPSYMTGSRLPPIRAIRARHVAPPSASPYLAGDRSVGDISGKALPAPVPQPAVPKAPPPTYPMPYPPITNFPWHYGDPLFCGNPMPSEVREAADEAHTLGPPRRARTAAGVRVLVVGDSTACSLYPGLQAVGDEVGANVEQAAVFGCGVASGQITTTRNEQITPHTERCPVMVDEAEVPAIADLRPDVVVWMSLWEKSDVVVGNKTLVSGTPEGDAEMLRRMDTALTRLTFYGAKVAVLTVAAPAPNDAEGVGNTSNAVDDASYARLDSILHRFAADHPGVVTLVDLARQVCPHGPPCPEEVGGLRLRPDGRHFTPAAATIEARWLLPRILEGLRR